MVKVEELPDDARAEFLNSFADEAMWTFFEPGLRSRLAELVRAACSASGRISVTRF